MDNYQIPNTDNIGFEEEEPVYHRNKLVKKLEFEFDDIVYPRRHIDEAFEKKRDTLTFANGMELKKSTDYTNLAKIDVSKKSSFLSHKISVSYDGIGCFAKIM